MNEIVLYRDATQWLAKYQGLHATEIKELFGGDVLPTAFLKQALPSDVLRTIATLNPKARIGIKAQEFGKASVEACRLATGEDVVWFTGLSVGSPALVWNETDGWHPPFTHADHPAIATAAARSAYAANGEWA